MKTSISTWISVLMLMLALPISNTANANNTPLTYQFTLIAEGGTMDRGNIGGFALNNAGTVSFAASPTSPAQSNTQSVLIGNGGPITTLATIACGITCLPIGTSINDQGTVVIRHGQSLDVGFISTVRHMVLNTVLTTNYSHLSQPFINNENEIVFATEDPVLGPLSVYVLRDKNLMRIARDITGTPMINDAGTVVFNASVQQNIPAIFISKNGERIRVVDASGSFSSFTEIPVINNRGTVAFSGTLKDGTQGVFKIMNGETIQIADTRGPFSDVTSAPFSINNRNDVAFGAVLKTGETGIFTGPDPVADRVISVGDSLFCSTVQEVSFSQKGLNDRGEVAFFAQLENGRKLIVLASPRHGNSNSESMK